MVQATKIEFVFVAIIVAATNVHFFTHKNTGVLKLFLRKKNAAAGKA